MIKNSIFALLMFSTLTHAQDMKPYATKPTNSKHKEIAAVLAEDKTNQIKYQTGKFTCHNFAKTLFLQRSTLVTDLAPYNIKAIASEWGNVIERKPETQKLPLYTVTMFNVESGFFHAINAVLINPNAPQSIDSYVFLEPQTDQIFDSAEAMYKHYDHYLKDTDTGRSLVVQIGIFSEYKFNGYIYQSFDKKIAEFKIF